MFRQPATVRICDGRDCDSTSTRPYLTGDFCTPHSPSARIGLPEPDSARYCAPGPGRCYCGSCPNWRPR